MDKLEYGTFSEVEIGTDGRVNKIKQFSIKNPDKQNNQIRTLEDITFSYS